MKYIDKSLQNILMKISKKYRDIEEETKIIERDMVLLNKAKDESLSIEQRINIVKESLDNMTERVIKSNDINKKLLSKKVNYDKLFLDNSMDSWDKFDYIFIFILVSIYISLNCCSNNLIDKGKEIHDRHSKKPNAQIKERNRYHYKMPNDTIPDGHLGIENLSNRFKINGKINDINFNHRLIYGHDLFKPFEVFKDLDKIVDIKAILGSEKLGAIVKQSFHLFYDTFSKTGIPVPGSTYFIDFFTRQYSILSKKFRIIESQDQFIELLTIHIEDIVKSFGINTVIYLYFRARNQMIYKNENGSLSIKELLKDIINIDIDKKNYSSIWIGNRTFKEYEMGIIAHSLIIYFQVLLPGKNRGKVNWVSVNFLLKDTVDYVRLSKKWNKNYENYIVYELQKLINLEIPKERKEYYKFICKKNEIDYSDNMFELFNNIENKLENIK